MTELCFRASDKTKTKKTRFLHQYLWFHTGFFGETGFLAPRPGIKYSFAILAKFWETQLDSDR